MLIFSSGDGADLRGGLLWSGGLVLWVEINVRGGDIEENNICH